MRVLEKLFDIVAPHSCLVCGRESRLICVWCWPEAFDIVPSRCYRCNKVTRSSATCKKCLKTTSVKYAWVATNYEKLAKELVTGMKYRQHRQAAYLIAAKLDELLPYLGDVVITHVPTATSRMRQRGFDHSKFIARELASVRGTDYVPLLARVSQLRQVGAPRKKRILQAEGAYRAINPRHLRNKHVLLVDDVLTTGATIEEAARTLKRAGAKQIDAAIFAQAI